MSYDLGGDLVLPAIRKSTVALACHIKNMWASHPGSEPSCDCGIKHDLSFKLCTRTHIVLLDHNSTYRQGPHAWRVRFNETL